MNPKLTLIRQTPTPSRPVARIVSGVLTLALLVATIGTVTTFAQDASPVAPTSRLAALGYPELHLVATDTGFESPDEIPAGRYLIVLDNQGTPGGPAQVSDVNLIQLPPAAQIDELNALLLEDGATPPDWYSQIVSSGGFYVEAGETGYAVLDLPDQIPAGTQVWCLTNPGEQQHALTFARTPELMTVEQVQAFLSPPADGTPGTGVPDPATVEVLTAELKNLLPGREIWVEMDLSPGAHAAICGIIDPDTGAPHALFGEADTFIVT